MTVSVVILNYNGRKHLASFLAGVIEHSQEAEIVIVDNASTDDSVTWLQQNHPSIRLVILEKNYGFAQGYNEGLKAVEADVYILLNSDVEVTENWIPPLMEMLVANDVAAVQPKIRAYHQKDTFEYAGAAGGLMDPLGFPLCRGRMLSTVEKDHGQYNDELEVFWATGAAMAIKSDLYWALEGLDGDYFAHMEEIDLCWRLKRCGYKIMYTPNSTVYHVGGGTLSYQSPFKTYLNFRNSWVTNMKNFQTQRTFKFVLRFLLDIVAILRFALIFQFKNVRAVTKSWGYLLSNQKKIRAKRQASDAQIKKHSIGDSRAEIGRFPHLLIWQYYILSRKSYKK